MVRHRRRHGDLDLVLAGSGPYRPPGWVRRLGFLDDEAKRAVVAGAVASVSASRMESFSLVLLEAWSEGTPTLCDAACGPMAEHTRDGGGGLVYRDAGSFSAGLQTLCGPGCAGRGSARPAVTTCWSGSAGTRSASGSGPPSRSSRAHRDRRDTAGAAPTGIGTYLRDTISACGRTPRGHEIVALSMGGRTETAGLAQHLDSPPGVVRRHRRVRGSFLLRRFVNAAPIPLLEPIAGRAGAFIGSEWLYPRQRSGVRGAIVYDLVPLRFPEWSTPETRALHGRKLADVKRCDVVVCISEATAGDVRDYLGIDAARVAIARPGVGDRFRDAPRHRRRRWPAAPTSRASARTSPARTW